MISKLNLFFHDLLNLKGKQQQITRFIIEVLLNAIHTIWLNSFVIMESHFSKTRYNYWILRWKMKKTPAYFWIRIRIKHPSTYYCSIQFTLIKQEKQNGRFLHFGHLRTRHLLVSYMYQLNEKEIHNQIHYNSSKQRSFSFYNNDIMPHEKKWLSWAGIVKRWYHDQ